MTVTRIYQGESMVYRVYHKGEIIFMRDPITFHVIDNDGLIILGAITANSLPEGLYLDCEPERDWEYPVKNGNVLTIEQVYLATPNGNILEVE